MTIAPVRPAPADWYDDPSGLPEQRWWDGRQWTDLLRPAPAPGAPAVTVRVAVPGPSRPTAGGTGRDPFSRYAAVLGLLSVLVNPFLAPSAVAICCGLLGLRRARRRLRAGRAPFGAAGAGWGLAAGLTGLLLSLVFKGGLL